MGEEQHGDVFMNPLVDRYAGRLMTRLFSRGRRHRAWRDMWIALARAEHELGLPVTAEQVRELEEHRDEFDWERVAALEGELRHDVMAHLRHYGELAPGASGILHLGATSAFVTDNADLLILREALGLVEARICEVTSALAAFAREHRALACLGYTHFQVAQPVTVGKRACLWIADLLLDLDEIRRLRRGLPCRGVKGTTGTQASFLSLFDGDHEKVRQLDQKVATAIGFDAALAVTGQTYTRKIDWSIQATLSGIAQSAAKFAGDIRLLSHEGELEEPSLQNQVGSSAMPYKKNPMRSERICSLARYVICAAESAAHTTAAQWLERTLDDSAVRRIALPECFLAIDAILILMGSVAGGMAVYPRVIQQKLLASMPFLATEEILMAGVRAGGDRQLLHERIRVHAKEAARLIKVESRPNPLLEMIAADPAFAAVKARLHDITEPARFIGRAPQQVDEFLRSEVEPRLAEFSPGEAEDELHV